jgi:hypothetical protein
MSKWKTHIASALAVRGSTTERGSDNNTAESVGTLCVGDDCEVHEVKNVTSSAGSCEI